jgi:hypothetical protein
MPTRWIWRELRNIFVSISFNSAWPAGANLCKEQATDPRDCYSSIVVDGKQAIDGVVLSEDMASNACPEEWKDLTAEVLSLCSNCGGLSIIGI